MASPSPSAHFANESLPSEGFSVDPVELNHLVVDLTGLLESEATGETFFPRYLERILQITKATGAAFWQRHSAGHLELFCEFNFGALGLDQTKLAADSHSLLLEDALLTRRASWVDPTSAKAATTRIKANLSPFALLLVPVLVEDKAVGLLQLFFPQDQDRQTKRALVRLSTEVVGFAAAFLHKRQWKALQDERQVWQELEAFAAQIHRSLDPQEVACLVANDGKRLVKCDQLSVAQGHGKSYEVLAISGAVTLERSPLVRAMKELLGAVGDWGEALTYQGTRDESLPPMVLKALDQYLALSNSRLLIALPLPVQTSGGDKSVAGILLAESFGGNPNAEQLRGRLESIRAMPVPP